MSPRRRLRTSVGRAARRLSPTARLLETRLGPSAVERGDLHERLDVLERYGAHLAEQGDRNTRETVSASEAVTSAVAAARDELRVELDHIRSELADRIEAMSDLLRSEPIPDPADLAFVAAALSSLSPGASVLVLEPVSVAAGLASIGLQVSTVRPFSPVMGARLLHPEALEEDAWDAVVQLGPSEGGPDGARLVAPGGLLVTLSLDVPVSFEVAREHAGRRCLIRSAR